MNHISVGRDLGVLWEKLVSWIHLQRKKKTGSKRIS